MAMFDPLINDIASRFGLGSNAAPLVREALALITGAQGGVGGFLNLFKTAGLSSEVASWLGSSTAAPLAGPQIEKALGASAVAGIANRFGLGQAAVSTALGYAIPKLIGLLTPNGVIPTSLPAEAERFLSPAPATAQAAPKRIDVYKTPEAKTATGLPGWLWPLVGALAILGIGWFLWPRPAENPVAQAPASAPVAQTQAPAPTPVRAATLTLANENGVVQYTGSVHDEQARTSIVDALKAAFGADRIKGDIAVDPNLAAAPWLANLRAALDALKVPGVKAAFEGGSVNVGGAIVDADRENIVASLKSALGSGLVVMKAKAP